MFATVLSPATETETVEAPPEQTREDLIERHLPLVTFTLNRMSEFLGSGVMERDEVRARRGLEPLGTPAPAPAAAPVEEPVS